MDSDDFFDQGDERPEIVAGRYRLLHPETGEERSWTRATTHAELPEDSYALTRWMLRQLLIGLHRRPDLLRLVESWAEEPGRDDLDAVITTAHEVAGNNARANLGTAVHGVLQRVDRAWNDAEALDRGSDEWLTRAGVPEWALPHARSYVAELRRNGLKPIPTMVERRVINLDLGCAGTLDNLYEEADGAVVLGDKKTGRLDYPERKYAIQLAVYHGSSHLVGQDGGPPVDLRSLGLRREYAVLVYVDPESSACSVYRVDMRRAQYGANLAAEVREWRRERHFLLPYVAPGAVPAERWRAAERAEGGRHLAAVPVAPPGPLVDYRDPVTEEALGQNEVRRQRPDLYDENGTPIPAVRASVTGDPGTFAVSGGLADAGNEHSANSTTATLGDVLNAELGRAAGLAPGEAWTADALMKLSKAELQGVLRGLDPGATVAHQRKILADKILTLQDGGRVATTTPALPGSAALAKVRAEGGLFGKDPAELPAGPIGGGEDPTDPRSPAFRRARLAEVAAAPSVAELGRIHAMVTRLGGDQAWTDEMTEAARARTAHLDSIQVRKIDWKGRGVTPAEAVARAESSREMAQVWNLVTVGGSDEAAWTPELNERAHARLAALQAAVEQAPPATPFEDPS